MPTGARNSTQVRRQQSATNMTNQNVISILGPDWSFPKNFVVGKTVCFGNGVQQNRDQRQQCQNEQVNVKEISRQKLETLAHLGYM